eukprot:CAMPEP_0194502770 /NCGR_PEP_ID=MMETSP0253-20130528/27038_1 /TAXON_ID=2966 /ORGANISM="Noctiluca scintillans" /LENGTH=55 /DNA_ID=CAMNT_0039344983 /DNA_START=60 /DNA_END=223 /DNA_ORIENTATION=+
MASGWTLFLVACCLTGGASSSSCSSDDVASMLQHGSDLLTSVSASGPVNKALEDV